MSQFRVAGVVAPDYRQPVPHRVHRRLCTPVVERGWGNKEVGGREGFDFAIARASGNPRLIVFTVRQRQAARVEI